MSRRCPRARMGCGGPGVAAAGRVLRNTGGGHACALQAPRLRTGGAEGWSEAPLRNGTAERCNSHKYLPRWTLEHIYHIWTHMHVYVCPCVCEYTDNGANWHVHTPWFTLLFALFLFWLFAFWLFVLLFFGSGNDLLKWRQWRRRGWSSNLSKCKVSQQRRNGAATCGRPPSVSLHSGTTPWRPPGGSGQPERQPGMFTPTSPF